MNEKEQLLHGFKRISTANWSQPDLPILFPFLTEGDWFEAVLLPQMSPGVPSDVKALYEVARASFVYGWLFYPLLAQGTEQCFRVLEAAVRMKCEQTGFPQRKGTTFKANIGRLLSTGIIPTAECQAWEDIRRRRNEASHPKFQTILPPGMVLPVLSQAAERVNRLFK